MVLQARNFLGLLHIAEQRHANLRNERNPLSIYCRMAAFLAKTVRQSGSEFTLVTSNAPIVAREFEGLSVDWCKILPLKFEMDVPRDIPFYSAHFKLEVFGNIARGCFGDEAGVIDLDALILRPFSPLDRQFLLSAYDISEQVFSSYGRDHIVADLDCVAGEKLKDPRWYGGEYLYGPRDLFDALFKVVNRCWPRYRQLSGRHNFGDEMVTSAALNLLRMEGVRIHDLGRLGEVARWWSARTLSSQPPFHEAAKAAFLHLPADKRFLAKRYDKVFSRTHFLEEYRSYARRKIVLRRVQNCRDRLARRPTKFLPRL